MILASRYDGEDEWIIAICSYCHLNTSVYLLNCWALITIMFCNVAIILLTCAHDIFIYVLA